MMHAFGRTHAPAGAGRHERAYQPGWKVPHRSKVHRAPRTEIDSQAGAFLDPMSLHLPVIPTTPEAATTRDDSFLDRIGVATPCDAAWDDMKGSDRVRFCGHCKLHVYNLSAMSRSAAAALVREREGRLCVRLFKRADGTLITEDCWSRLRRARQKGVWAFACALAVVAATQLFANAFGLRLAVDSIRRASLGTVGGAAVALQGEPVAPIQGGVAPMPPRPLMGDILEPPREVKGEMVMGKVATPRPLMGSVAVPATRKPAHLMGRVRVR